MAHDRQEGANAQAGFWAYSTFRDAGRMNDETIYKMDLLSSENGTEFRPLTIKLTKVSVGEDRCSAKHRAHRHKIRLAETSVLAVVVDHCPAATHSEGTFLSEADLKKLLCPLPSPTSEVKVRGSRREFENTEGFVPKKKKKRAGLEKRRAIDTITPDREKQKIKITIPIPKHNPPASNLEHDPDSNSKEDSDNNPKQDPDSSPKQDPGRNSMQKLGSNPIIVQPDQNSTVIKIQTDANPTILEPDHNSAIVQPDPNIPNPAIVQPGQNSVTIQPNNDSKPVRSFVRSGRRKSSKLRTRRRVELANQNAEEFVQKKIRRRAVLAKRRNVDVIIPDRAKRKIIIPSKFEGFDLETIPVPETRVDIGTLEQDLNSISSLQETKQSSPEKMDQSADLETEEITEKFDRNRKSSDSEYIENALPKSKARRSWKSNVNDKSATRTSVPSVSMNRIRNKKKRRPQGRVTSICPKCQTSHTCRGSTWRHMKFSCNETKIALDADREKHAGSNETICFRIGKFVFFQCYQCTELFSNRNALGRHKYLVHDEAPLAHPCPNCTNSYPHLSSLERHQRTFHKNKKTKTI